MFGPRARADYTALLNRALALLRKKPDRAGAQRRDDLAGAPFVFHLRHARARGASPKQPRHIIVFTFDDATVTVLRVLHDSMDLPRQLGGEDADG